MLALAALLSCFALSPDLCPTASAAHGHGTMLAVGPHHLYIFLNVVQRFFQLQLYR